MTMKGCIARNNRGDGFHFEGVKPDMENCIAEGNGGHGVVVISAEVVKTMRALGLPDGLDPKEVANLLVQMQSAKPDDRKQIVNSSGLVQRLGTLAVNVPTVIASLLTIAADPNVHQLIAHLRV